MKHNVTIKAMIAILSLPFLFSACRSTDKIPAAAPAKVVVQRVIAAGSDREFAYSGTIVESETTPHSFAVAGTVTRVHVDEGQAVTKGMLLAEIDDTSYRNGYDMAKSAEKQAEDAFNRLSRMYKNGNLPEVKYVEAESGLQRARAAAANAKKNLDDCRLYAHAAGYVGRRAIEPGMIAMPNLASITVVGIDKVYARIPIPENDIALVRKGDPGTVRIGALATREFQGTVEDIGVVAEPLARTYRIQIAVANPDRAIKPGMVCTAVLQSAGRSRSLVVPSEAVMVDETGRNFVYGLDATGAKARLIYVKIGALLAGGTEITDGLAANDIIVVSGQHKLADGASVLVVGR
jgi:membrane fusion protein, multidrug efflux system